MEAHQVRDVTLGVGLTIVGVLEGTLGLTGGHEPWYLVATVPLVTAAAAVRRRHPLALALLVGGFLLQGVARSDLPGGFAEPIALVLVVYSLGAHLDVRRSGVLASAVAGVMAVVIVLQGGAHPANFVFMATEVAAAWAAGVAVHLATRHTALLAEQRAMRERSRIARELHDVVSHNVSAMVVQAAAERRGLSSSAPQAAVLEQIERNGRQTLTELRRLLGVLRLDDSAPVEPQPRLRDLDGLIDGARRAGQPVSYVVEGEPRDLGDGLELAVFRVVQEGLTNVRKHAAGAPAVVALRWTGEALEVEVCNPCATAPGHAVPGSGLGLASMRERIAAYDGTVAAGRAGDEFVVRVRVPVGPSA